MQGINKQTMLDLIIDAKRNELEDVRFSDWLAEYLAEHLSTLTPQNEIPPCYRPDGDGCAYQCYDGQDEPIDKCKECPLCYSDKQRHHAPQNEPLTCEGCDMQGKKVTPCASCIRDPRVCDYYTSRPPEGEEGDVNRG